MPSQFENPAGPSPENAHTGSEMLARARAKAEARQRQGEADAERWRQAETTTNSAIQQFIQGMLEAGEGPVQVSFTRRTKAYRRGEYTTKPYEDIPRSAVLGWTVRCGEHLNKERYVITVDGTVFKTYQDESPGAHNRFGRFTPVAVEPPEGFPAALEHELEQVLLGRPRTP